MCMSGYTSRIYVCVFGCVFPKACKGHTHGHTVKRGRGGPGSCVTRCVYLAEIRISLSVHLWMFFLLFLSLRAAGCQFRRHLLYCLCGTPSQNTTQLCRSVSQRSGPYPLVFYHFADVDGCLGVLPEVPLLLEKEALSALPTKI